MVRALFAVAAALQPAVIFIDEIDSILSARKSEGLTTAELYTIVLCWLTFQSACILQVQHCASEHIHLEAPHDLLQVACHAWICSMVTRLCSLSSITGRTA